MEKKITCPYCGANINSTERVCEYCGCENPYFNADDYYEEKRVINDQKRNKYENDPEYVTLQNEYRQLQIAAKFPTFVFLIFSGFTFFASIMMFSMTLTMSSFGGGTFAPFAMVGFFPLAISVIFLILFITKTASKKVAQRKLKEVEQKLDTYRKQASKRK